MSEKKAEISSLENIDTGFYNHINEIWNIHTNTNRGSLKVPVLWLSAERTFQIKNDRTFRDSVGKLRLPIITIERDTFEKDRSFKGAFQADIPTDFAEGRQYKARPLTVQRRTLQDKTRHYASSRSNKVNKGDKNFPDDKFKTISSKKIVQEVLKSPMPVYVKIMYKINLRAEYQQQINDMVTPFISRTGQVSQFVFENNGYRYEAFIDGAFNQANNSENLGEEERSFMTSINVKVLGYVMGDGENDPLPTITTEENIVEVKISRERAVTQDEIPWLPKDNKYRSI